MTPNQIIITIVIMVTIFILVSAYKLLCKSYDTRYSKRLTLEGWNYYEYSFQCYHPISKSKYIEGKVSEKKSRNKLRNT